MEPVEVSAECLVCYCSLTPETSIVLGACGHALCTSCARSSVVSSMEALAVAGGAQLPSRTASMPLSARGETTPVPGLLCCFCVGSDDAKLSYARAFEDAIVKREFPTPELLAATAAACPDVESWLASTARQGLPPGWISPSAFEKIRGMAAIEGTPILPVHVAAYERSVIPAVLLVASLVREADRARPAASAESGAAGADAAASSVSDGVVPPSPSLQRAPSAVRPVPCPNSGCKQILAIGASSVVCAVCHWQFVGGSGADCYLHSLLPPSPQ